MDDRGDRSGAAWLVAIATAVAGFLPATYAYERITGWLRPMRHAEESMGRGLEVLFIGGPVSAALLAALAGWLTYRSRSPAANRNAAIFIAGCAALSVVIARRMSLL